MRSIKKNGLKYFQFESIPVSGITQAVFTRHGGLSNPPWSSLNFGGTVGDNPESVKGNLNRLLTAVGYQEESLVQVRQIHSANVVVAEKPMDGSFQGDAIITKTKGLLLLMRFADCVPIMFYDPVRAAAGIAHAGWQGTLKEICLQTVRTMETRFGSDPADIVVGIGPSIGPDHYYVGDDVIEQFNAVFPDSLNELLSQDTVGVKLDLWRANTISLLKAGVKRIEISGICTGCNTSDWFSHRAEGGMTGRFAAVIGLN